MYSDVIFLKSSTLSCWYLVIIETIWFLSGIFFFTNPGNKYYNKFFFDLRREYCVLPSHRSRKLGRYLALGQCFPIQTHKNNYHCANLQAARSNPVDVRPNLVKRLLVTFESKIEIKAGIF